MIRNALNSDLDGIVNLWVQMSTLHSDVDSFFLLKKGAENIFKNYAEKVLADLEKLNLVYEENNSILGYLFAEIINQPPVYQEEQIGLISEISVDSNSRRAGIGENLLKKSEEWFKRNGIKRIDCQVATKNLISTNFWNKNGYNVHSRICSKRI